MTSKRPLNSDGLGRKGESRFEELCIDAGLVPNPSSWDRKGWDFIVEWPHSNVGSFDSRPAPISCFVQSKTVWDDTASIRLRLSSIEAIAKSLKPAFVHVLQVNNASQFVGSFVLHLEGELLGHILKRLRKAYADGDQPNKVHMTLSLSSWATALPPTGAAFRGFVEKAVGGSLESYLEEKRRQLRTLGFKKGHVTLRAMIEGGSVDQITDAFLGIGRLDTKFLDATETRFGIPLPAPAFEFDSGTIEFQPKHRDKCIVTVRRPGGDTLIRKNGKMYSLPAEFLHADTIKVLIRTNLFDLVVKSSAALGVQPVVSIKFSTDAEKLRNERLAAAEWRDFYDFLLALFREDLRIDIQPSMLDEPLTGTIRLDPGPELSSGWQYAAELTRAAADILDRATWPGTKLSIDDMVKVERELLVLHAMMTSASDLTPLRFTSGIQVEPISLGPTKILYFGYIPLDKHALVYAASCQLVGYTEGDGIRWVGDGFEVLDVDRIRPKVGAFNHFTKKLVQRTGIGSYFAPSLEPEARTLEREGRPK